MIDLAVQQLTERLTALPFLDLVGGVARAQKVVLGGMEKTLPASPNPEKDGEYLLLSPDGKRAGIAYFEVLSNKNTGSVAGGRGSAFAVVVRLVVWLNTKRLAPAGEIALAMASCVSTLSGKYAGVPAPLGNMSVEPLQEAPRSADLFGRYTYNEAESQYLMLPFEYFAFDFALMFTMASACPALSIMKVEEAC